MSLPGAEEPIPFHTSTSLDGDCRGPFLVAQHHNGVVVHHHISPPLPTESTGHTSARRSYSYPGATAACLCLFENGKCQVVHRRGCTYTANFFNGDSTTTPDHNYGAATLATAAPNAASVSSSLNSTAVTCIAQQQQLQRTASQRAHDRRVMLHKKVTLYQHYYPEGNWGWIILAVALVIQVLCQGVVLSFGLLLPWIQFNFGPGLNAVLTGEFYSLFCQPLLWCAWSIDCKIFLYNAKLLLLSRKHSNETESP